MIDLRKVTTLGFDTSQREMYNRQNIEAEYQ